MDSKLKIKDQNGRWVEITGIKGEKGDKGDQGDQGDDYVLTAQDKQDIAGLVDVPVDDVQVRGKSIVTNGTANVPIANGQQVLGLTQYNSTYGITVNADGRVQTFPAISSEIKGGTNDRRPITPSVQHESAFYGLAKASGDTTQSQSTNAIGTYTDDAKTAIQTMLGVPSENDVVIDVQINGSSIIQNGVANIPYAGNGAPGLVRAATGYGTALMTSSGHSVIGISAADDNGIKNGVQNYNPIVPSKQHKSVFYGLAKAAGDSTQSSSSNSVGTYTDDAKDAIQHMLGVPPADGVVTDVTVDGTSVMENGVAVVPRATSSTAGVVRVHSDYGLALSGNLVYVYPASVNQCKTGGDTRHPVTPSQEHTATFFGLAKAAGDTTQAESSNAVGTYTDEAKTAIKQMLDIKDDYDSLVVEVSGTDPVITGKPSYRYNCGELYTLTVTPPASGTIDIIFTSGTTPTVLSLPNTVKMPDWWAGIETNTTYEMCITDGTYCGVMSWAT